MAITNPSKKAKLALFAIIITVIIALVMIYATGERCNKDRIIGKTRVEIEAAYGAFDITLGNLAVYEISEDFSDTIWRYFMGDRHIITFISSLMKMDMLNRFIKAPARDDGFSKLHIISI